MDDIEYYSVCTERAVLDLSPMEAVEATRDKLRRAVSRQLVSDVEVGAFLSGGVDSSGVVAAAVHARGGEPMPCFTIGIEDPVAQREGMGQDLPHAREVARHLGVDLHTTWVGPEMIDSLGEMLYFLDEPQADPAPINALLISRSARDQGIRVLLSGAGGDDLFAGYRRHAAARWDGALSRTPAFLLRAAQGVLGRLPAHAPAVRRASKFLEGAHLASDERLANYFHWAAPSTIRSLYAEGLAHAVEGNSPSAPLVDALASLPLSTDRLDRLLRLETRFFLADHNLNYTDKMGMAAGVEVRVPLLDLELVEFALSLPTQYKRRGMKGKWALREAVRPWLPDSVLSRKKVGFGAPLRAWLRGPLRQPLQECLSSSSLRARGLFDSDRVATLMRRNEEGSRDATYLLFSLMCVELWCRMFVDPKTPRPA